MADKNCEKMFFQREEFEGKEQQAVERENERQAREGEQQQQQREQALNEQIARAAATAGTTTSTAEEQLTTTTQDESTTKTTLSASSSQQHKEHNELATAENESDTALATAVLKELKTRVAGRMSAMERLAHFFRRIGVAADNGSSVSCTCSGGIIHTFSPAKVIFVPSSRIFPCVPQRISDASLAYL